MYMLKITMGQVLGELQTVREKDKISFNCFLLNWDCHRVLLTGSHL